MCAGFESEKQENINSFPRINPFSFFFKTHLLKKQNKLPQHYYHLSVCKRVSVSLPRWSGNINNAINISLYPFLPLQVIASRLCLHLHIDYVISLLTLGSDTAENRSLMQPHTIRSSHPVGSFGGLRKYLWYHLSTEEGEAATKHTESSWRLWPLSFSCEMHC